MNYPVIILQSSKSKANIAKAISGESEGAVGTQRVDMNMNLSLGGW